MRRGGLYDRSVRTIALIYLVIGVALLVLTMVRGGGLLSIGTLLGAAFIAIGVARYRLQQKLGEDE
jgi:hypothetical protein